MHFYSIYDQWTTHCVKSSFHVHLFNFGETLPKCNEFSSGKLSQGYDPTCMVEKKIMKIDYKDKNCCIDTVCV